TLLVDEVSGWKDVHKPEQAVKSSCWQTEKLPADGRSGGPIFDTNGYLIGICKGIGAEKGSTKGYYSAIDAIRRALADSPAKELLDDPTPANPEKSAPNGKKG